MSAPTLDLVYELQSNFGWDSNFATAADREYRRWLRLRAKASDFDTCKLPPSRVVALVWGLHRQWTSNYQRTCNELGGFLHHYPPAMRLHVGMEYDYNSTLRMYREEYNQDPPPLYWGPSILTHPRDPHSSTPHPRNIASVNAPDSPSAGESPSQQRKEMNNSTTSAPTTDFHKPMSPSTSSRTLRNKKLISNLIVPNQTTLTATENVATPTLRVTPLTSFTFQQQQADGSGSGSDNESGSGYGSADGSFAGRRSSITGQDPSTEEGSVLRPLVSGKKRRRGRPSTADYIQSPEKSTKTPIKNPTKTPARRGRPKRSENAKQARTPSKPSPATVEKVVRNATRQAAAPVIITRSSSLVATKGFSSSVATRGTASIPTATPRVAVPGNKNSATSVLANGYDEKVAASVTVNTKPSTPAASNLVKSESNKKVASEPSSFNVLPAPPPIPTIHASGIPFKRPRGRPRKNSSWPRSHGVNYPATSSAAAPVGATAPAKGAREHGSKNKFAGGANGTIPKKTLTGYGLTPQVAPSIAAAAAEAVAARTAKQSNARFASIASANRMVNSTQPGKISYPTGMSTTETTVNHDLSGPAVAGINNMVNQTSVIPKNSSTINSMSVSGTRSGPMTGTPIPFPQPPSFPNTMANTGPPMSGGTALVMESTPLQTTPVMMEVSNINNNSNISHPPPAPTLPTVEDAAIPPAPPSMAMLRNGGNGGTFRKIGAMATGILRLRLKTDGGGLGDVNMGETGATNTVATSSAMVVGVNIGAEMTSTTTEEVNMLTTREMAAE